MTADCLLPQPVAVQCSTCQRGECGQTHAWCFACERGGAYARVDAARAEHKCLDVTVSDGYSTT